MKTKIVRVALGSALLTLLYVSDGYSQRDWKKLRTVEEVCQAYPGRIDTLLSLLDPNNQDLAEVRRLAANHKTVQACTALLAHFRNGSTAEFLRRPSPARSEKTDPAADSIVRSIFTFYELTDVVPYRPNGQLDWSYTGPDDDIEWAWALNRHFHISSLLKAYLATGNPRYAETIDSHIQDWVISSLPYPRVKSSTAMWRGLEVSFRVKAWAHAFYALLPSDMLSPATALLLLTSIPEHTHYMRNFHAREGNWLTMEMSGLATAATAWPEFSEASAWLSYAKDQMEKGLEEQVYPDGVQKELTSMYHQVALSNFDLFADICREAKENLPTAYLRGLEKMSRYIALSVRPTGYGAMNNDADKSYNRDRILASAEKYGREDWRFIASNGKRGKRPDGPPSIVFPWAGQMIMRSGYNADAQWAFFDIGPWGTGHRHNDKLHLSITAYGRDLLVDGGRFAYKGQLADKFRSYATGSASHNVVLIDGNGQAPGPSEVKDSLGANYYKITDRFDYAWNSFDRFNNLQGAGKHTRAIFYVRGKFWIVVDRIDTDRPRKIQTLWHWHPDVKVVSGTDGVVISDNEKGNLSIIPVGFKGWHVEQIKGREKPTPQGWYSERYNKSAQSVASVYSTDIKQSTAFVWVLFPSEGKSGPVSAEVLSRDEDGITVRVGDERSNRWDVKVPFSGSAQADYTFTSGLGTLVDPKRDGTGDREAIAKLLSRLNLDAAGFNKVKNARNDPGKAAEALLQYYRARTSVKHPVDRREKAGVLGKYATEEDIRAADDALKHVFVGQGAYPPYYCGDDINWALRPVPDNEWVWQLNRMGFWDALGKAYWHTGDERYAREWCMQLLDWTQKNPRDQTHAYAWRSIEAGIRGYRWTTHYQRFVDAPSFTPAVLVAFLNSCYDHAEYLMTQYRKGSNWGLMEAEGMGFIAFTFPEFTDAKKWRDEAIKRLNAEIENQVYADGHQRELAIGYHTGCIGWFMRTLELARMNGMEDAFPKSYSEKIGKMCAVLLKLGLPDGTTTQFGDSWKGEPGHIWPALKQWSQTFDRDDFLYVATQGREGRKPGETAFALLQSGFYSMRSGWDEHAICLVLKCGPDGGGHCQPDNGTFELYAGGRHLMPDGGSYIYSGDPEGRAWFRQTKVHQTLTLNDANSAYAPRQLLWKPGKNLDVLVVENASYPELTHRRAVLFIDHKYFVIVDEAIGAAAGDVDLHFQLAPGNAVFNHESLAVRSDFADGWNVLVKPVKQEGMLLNEEEGWVSFAYTKKEPRPAFRYRTHKEAGEGVRFLTVVAPYEGTAPNVAVEVLGNPKVGSPRMDLKVTANGVVKKIRYEIPKK